VKPWLWERAARTPDALALEARGARISYGELNARAERRAGALRARGCAPGDRVGALFGNDPAFVEWLHAAARARVVLVPLNARLTPAEHARQLDHAGAHLLVHADEPTVAAAAHAVTALSASLRAVSSSELAQGSAAAPPADLDPAHPAALIFTSGTSGDAKGVVLSFGNLLASAIGSILHLGALPADRWLATLPLFHVGGLAILVRSTLAGSAVVLHERFDPLEVSRALDSDAISLVSFVPTMLARVLDVRGEAAPPASLRAILLGGAAAPAPLLERAAKTGWPVLPTYGLSEAASQVATLPPGAPLRSDGGGLRPLFGVEVRICDELGAELPDGTPGEILVRGATVTPGYWRNPEASARALADGWLHTGDLGVRDSLGGLAVVGRADDMLVTGGENVHPAEVEAALAEHPDVIEVAVAGLPDPDYGQRVAAWVVLAPGAVAGAADLESFARARLASYKLPRSWRFVRELPRNASGKLVRRELAEQARGDHAHSL